MRAALLFAALAASSALAAGVKPSPLLRTVQQLLADARRHAQEKSGAVPVQPQHVLRQLLQEANVFASSKLMHEKKLHALRNAGKKHVSTVQLDAIRAPTHSYFPANGTLMAMLPEFLGAANVGSEFGWSSACLSENIATVTAINGNTSNLLFNMTSSTQTGWLCSDFYLVATAEHLELITVTAAGSQTKTFTVSTPKSSWVARNGIRVFRFLHDPLTSLGDLVATLGMFLPSLSEVAIDSVSAQTNLGFLRDYIGFVPEVRPIPTPQTITMDWSIVQSGDLLMVQRLDGLGVLEDWGTGAVTSHTVMAIRRGPSQDLYIFEATSHDAYWPVEGVQLTPIDTWAAIAANASFAVVHVPISDAIRARWNDTAVQALVDTALAQGWPYGYRNFIATFWDTGALPWPASAEFIEIAFNVIESIDASISDMLLGDLLNMRFGTVGLDLTQLADVAAAANLTFAQAVSIPEQDDWVYSNGPNMVCDVLFCYVHKVAGSFGDLADSITCREFHNLDVYRLNFFNLTAPRPAVCQQYDPGLPYCQAMGTYRLDLNWAGQLSNMEPYPHMNERCTALPMGYQRTPAQC